MFGNAHLMIRQSNGLEMLRSKVFWSIDIVKIVHHVSSRIFKQVSFNAKIDVTLFVLKMVTIIDKFECLVQIVKRPLISHFCYAIPPKPVTL